MFLCEIFLCDLKARHTKIFDKDLQSKIFGNRKPDSELSFALCVVKRIGET